MLCAQITLGFDLRIGANGYGTLPIGALSNGIKFGFGFNGFLYFKPENMPVGFEIESGYSYSPGKIVDNLQIIPLYLFGVYNLPTEFARTFVKLGVGLNFETLKMDEGKMTNTDFGVKLGTGIEYLFFKNLGARFSANYIFIYEPETIGHFLEFQLGILYAL